MKQEEEKKVEAMSQVYLKLSLLGLLVVAVVTPSANAIRKSVVLGGKSDVPNVQTNMEVQELGRYACIHTHMSFRQNKKCDVIVCLTGIAWKNSIYMNKAGKET